MKVTELISTARDAITVRRVFGDPYERDGVTVIPAALVRGGAGGGSGEGEKGDAGEGGGFAVQARPAGAFVITDGQVVWSPAVDPNRIVAVALPAAALVAVTYLLSRSRRQVTR